MNKSRAMVRHPHGTALATPGNMAALDLPAPRPAPSSSPARHPAATSHRRRPGQHYGLLSEIPPPARRTATPHGLRIAAIDIGTNSLHLVVVEVTAALDFRVLASEREFTQLGAGALVHHVLERAAMRHALSVLGRYVRVARNLQCDSVLAYATSAVRESVNGGDFVELAKVRLGLDIRVITGQEEARLIYLAVRQAVGMEEGPALIIDIGGGSAEFIVGLAGQARLLESCKLGASRLTEQFFSHDPPTKAELKHLRRHLQAVLKPVLLQVSAWRPRKFIGTSGLMENLAAMCVARHAEDEARRRVRTELRRDDFRSLYKKLLAMDLKQRRRLPGLDPRRARQIVAGAVLVDYLLTRLDIPKLEVSDRALREGMILDYLQTHWPQVRLAAEIIEPRRRSVVELGRRCHYDERHHQQVARLAVALFDQLAGLHQLGRPYRELLEFAARLHDIGWHIGHSGHHKHSYYLIKNGDLEGFSPLELELIANVARYHRRSMPKKSHAAYMQLRAPERSIVDRLAALLRLAEGLDRGHYANVLRLRTVRRRGLVRLNLLTRYDWELELWAVRHKADMLESVYGVRLRALARQSRRGSNRNGAE